MKTAISVYKPVKFVADLTDCATLGDLVNTIKTIEPTVLGVDDGLEYFAASLLGPQSSAGIAATIQHGKHLSGLGYNAHSPLPTINHSQLHIVATPQPEYTLSVLLLSPSSGRSDLWTNIDVAMNDQVIHLKKHIRGHLGLLESCQMILYKGRHLEDSAYLFEEGICENSTVTVAIKVEVGFRYKQTVKPIVSAQSATLLDLLKSFAEEQKLDILTLCFVFVNPSGTVANCAKGWLPDRTQLFKAKEVSGTVRDNGIMQGNEIQVYERNAKRKRVCFDSDFDPEADRDCDVDDDETSDEDGADAIHSGRRQRIATRFGLRWRS
ncbi:hypothetical protein A1O3_07782 [Capronia epimyces CBS 606.96]|uniref:Ubiquitin-like domain-containing protein n=1 Tax=Capronia epimyces CBS 606.96 TaxID=1182542 RepID=W9YGT1_9EURO|nr:uncharacterized protein A1O3_07782 [Capronia epimyces CBS 606.96]EXJ81489.1 hypothetical protein A1O3_07782 [Capronia epimyces CBS 606.96]